MTEEDRNLIRKYLWCVIYSQRSVLKSAKSFLRTDSEWLAKHVIKHFPKYLHKSIKNMRMTRDSYGYEKIISFIEGHLEVRNQSMDEYIEESKNLYCFDQAVIAFLPRVWPELVKNEIV